MSMMGGMFPHHFEHDGIDYPYDIDDVMDMAERGRKWVWRNEEKLGVRRFLVDRVTHVRFPADVDERVHRVLGDEA